MIVLNAILTLIVSVAVVHLLQESYVSPREHRGDFRYYMLRYLTIAVALASLHTNAEPPNLSVIFLNGSLATALVYLTKYF